MPRPRKHRRVCKTPNIKTYGPINKENALEEDIVIMAVEELETIRLMDLEGMSQQESANMMEIGRSTFQRIYNDAKRKVAESIINGKILKIEGGNYKVCGEDLKNNTCNHCFRKRRGKGHGRGKK